MKKIYDYLVPLLLFMVGVVQARAAAEGWEGKSIQTVGERISTISELPDVGYFLLRNNGRNIFAAESDGKLVGTAPTTSTTLAEIQAAFIGTEHTSAVVKVVKISDGYQLQFLSGNYMTSIPYNVQPSTGTTAGTVTINGVSNVAGIFNIKDPNTKQYLNGNPTNPVGWNESATSTTHNSAYSLYPVTFADLHTLTYNIHIGNQTTQKTYKLLEGESYPTPVCTSRGFFTLTDIPTGTMGTEDVTYDITLTYNMVMPFPIAYYESSVNDQSWRTLKARSDVRWVYADGTSTALNDTDNGTWKPCASVFYGTSTYEDVKKDFLWAVIGNPVDGFQIKNKLTNTYMCLANYNDNTPVTLAAATDANTRFDIVCHTNGKWYIRKMGSAFDYLNFRDEKLATWNNSGALGDYGSGLVFHPADYMGDLKKSNIPGYVSSVGGFDFSGAAASDLQGQKLFDTYKKIALKEGAYYKIRASRTDGNQTYADGDYRWLSTQSMTASGANGALEANDNRELNRVQATALEVPMLWKFESKEGNFQILNANANIPLSPAVQGNLDVPSTSWYESNKKIYYCYKLVQVPNTYNQWYLKKSDAEVYLKALGGCKDASSTTVGDETSHTSAPTDDAGFNWYIIPTSTITLTVYNDTKWASVKYPFGVTLPEGLEAYIATATGNSEVTLTSIGTELPANTPAFILDSNTSATTEGTASYQLTINDNVPAITRTDLLDGTTIARSGYAAGQFYGLAANNGTGKLLKNGTSLTTVAANKAYLPTANVSTEAAALTFRFGLPTDIQGVTTETESAAPKAYYDLQGRRVLYPAHGIFVTDKGQKVYMK